MSDTPSAPDPDPQSAANDAHHPRTVIETSEGVTVDVTPIVTRVEESIIELKSEIHRGPLPAPETLRQYDAVVPGLAERIVSMTEREQLHRHELQRISVKGSADIAERGQHYGLGVVIFVLSVATLLILLGHETAGTIIASIDLAALATVFVVGRIGTSRSQKEREP